METEKLSLGQIFGESFNVSWRVFNRNWVFFVLAVLGYFILEVVLSVLFSDSAFLHLILRIINYLIDVIFSIEAFNVANLALKNENFNYKEYKPLLMQQNYANLFINYVIASIIVGLIILVGYIFLIVPGVILGLMFGFTMVLIVNKRMDAFDAMKESMRLTKGNKWYLFVLVISIMLLNLLGVICLGVGLLVTVPVSFLMLVWAYRKISHEEIEVNSNLNVEKSIDKGLNIN